jgi:hypothetical protein
LRIRMIALATALAAVVVAGAGTALADRTVIDYFQAKFVSAEVVKYRGGLDGRKACMPSRDVEIYHVEEDDRTLIATAFTNSDGDYKVLGPEPPEGDEVQMIVLKDEDCKRLSRSRTYHRPN